MIYLVAKNVQRILIKRKSLPKKFVTIVLYFPIQSVTVMLLDLWSPHVTPRVLVFATQTMLDQNATIVLLVITAIPIACVSNQPSFVSFLLLHMETP